MANTPRENRSNETAQRASHPETRGRNDVARTPETQHEVQRGKTGGGLAQRGGFDIERGPFAMMNALHREMDRLFDDFAFGGGNLFRTPRLLGDLDRSFGDLTRGGIWSPQIEIYERDGKLHVSADLPGLNKDDVKIEVLDNQLTIEGERRSEQRDERGGWSERSYGRFYRSVSLPEGVNGDTASASFDNGVLHITFDAPKREERRGKPIPIGSK